VKKLLISLACAAALILGLAAARWHDSTQQSDLFIQSNNVKMVIFAPKSHGDAIRAAIGAMGAGRIGNYGYCSFTTEGTGRWMALEGAHPVAGEIGSMEQAVEDRIEFIVPKNKVKLLLQEIARIHPYDRFGYDIYPLIEL